MNKDVFISYKSEEFEEANYMKLILEKNGISCWMAPNSISGGSSYAKEIPNAIKNAKVFLLILSNQAQQSKWVPRELDQAINAGKIIMPFMIENCSLTDDFNFYLTNVQRYDAYENKTAAVNKIIREIKGVLGVDGENKEPEKRPVEKKVSEIAVVKKKEGFFKKITPLGRKKAKLPEYKFSMKITNICAVANAMFFALLFFMAEVANIGVVGAFLLTVVCTLAAWYIDYAFCAITSKIKKWHKLWTTVILLVVNYFAMCIALVSAILLLI